MQPAASLLVVVSEASVRTKTMRRGGREGWAALGPEAHHTEPLRHLKKRERLFSRVT